MVGLQQQQQQYSRAQHFVDNPPRALLIEDLL
jgi:hypothetical protein